MLDFRVETFLCVCRTMNYTKASKELNITQPAVSAHIHFLEEHYHVRLFRYQNKKLYLTPEGAILRDRMRTLLNDENRVSDELSMAKSGKQTLSLGVTMTVGEYAVVKPLSGYIRENPDTAIDIHFGNTSELLDMLEIGKINVALVEGNYPKERYSHTNFSSEDYIPVCAASHRFIREPSCFKDLLKERLIVREKGSGTRNILECSLDARDMRIDDFANIIQVENMHTIIWLTIADCGISFLYKIAAAEEIERGRLKEIHLEDFSMKHDFDFIWEKGSIYSDRYLDFCSTLKREAEKAV
ncbi:MAG: LysR family transcriptional regulator [Candidatus Weimeria sp.]